MRKLCGSLFEQCNGAEVIDSQIYMKTRALTSLAALKIKDIVVPSPCSYKYRSVEKGVEQQRRQELEQPNTTVHPVLSKLFLSVRADEYGLKSAQATHWDVNMMQKSDGCCGKDLEAVLDLKVNMNLGKGPFVSSSARVSSNEMT